MEYLGCDEGGLAESMKQVRQTLFYADSLDLSFLRLFPTILCHVISINFRFCLTFWCSTPILPNGVRSARV